MFKWLHHLFNPHCEACKEEADERRICMSCEVLRDEIHRLRNENSKLLDSIITPRVEQREPLSTENLKPLLGATIPWHLRKNMLEATDRRKSELEKQALKNQFNTSVPTINSNQSSTVDELEKEIQEGV